LVIPWYSRGGPFIPRRAPFIPKAAPFIPKPIIQVQSEECISGHAENFLHGGDCSNSKPSGLNALRGERLTSRHDGASEPVEMPGIENGLGYRSAADPASPEAKNFTQLHMPQVCAPLTALQVRFSLKVILPLARYRVQGTCPG